MGSRAGCVLVAALLLAGCGGGDSGDSDEAVTAAAGPVLPGPQVTPKGAEPMTVTGTWGLNAACVFLNAGYGPIAPSFPKGWTYDAASRTVKGPDGVARGKIGQKVDVLAVSLDVVPKTQVLCAGSAIQVVRATVAKG